MGDETVVYAVGDVHGRADLLERLLVKIRTDAAQRSQGHKVLVYLGDYVDRGLESRAVIESLLAQGGDGLERVFLKGNHEDAMLQFLDSTEIGSSWMGFGGDATLYSYGVDVFGTPPEGVERLDHIQEQLRANTPPEHVAFLEGLELYHQEGDYFFVHAGVRPGLGLGDQDANDMMWIRDEFLNSTANFGKVVVHGHSIKPQPVVRSNRIGIDTGAFATGVLTCLVLAGAEQSFIQTRHERCVLPLNGDGVWCELLDQSVASGRPALFLDRDGVVVEEVNYLHKAADVRLMPGISDLIAAANRAGSAVVVVTNQSGVGRGIYGWADFDAVQKQIAAELKEAGATWNAVYASPFPPGDYPMRKPNPGMLMAGAAAFGVDLRQSWILGDRATDMEAGLRAGVVAASL